MKIIFLVMRP